MMHAQLGLDRHPAKRLLVMLLYGMLFASCGSSSDGYVMSNRELIQEIIRSHDETAPPNDYWSAQKDKQVGCPFKEIAFGVVSVAYWKDVNDENITGCELNRYFEMDVGECLDRFNTAYWHEQHFYDPDLNGWGQCIFVRMAPKRDGAPTPSPGTTNCDGTDSCYPGYNDLAPPWMDGFEYDEGYSCDGDCTDMDNDGRTWDDYDADGDGYYETP